MEIGTLIDAAKAGASIESDYRLGKILGIGDSAIPNWKAGRAWPSQAHILRLAEMAEMDAGQVLAAIQAQKAKTPEEREAWKRIAERLSRVAACIVAGVTLTVAGLPENSNADNRLASNSSEQQPIH